MVPLHCFQHFLETAESGYYIILDLPERLPLFRPQVFTLTLDPGQRNNLRGKSDKFISLPERKSAKVMETSGYRLLLPEGTLDYFIISDVKESSTEIVIYLEEKNEVPGEYSNMQVENKGFYEPVVVQDFPIRGKKLFLNIRRRRWIVKDEGRYVSRNWKLVAEGSRMTHDFASFLKELY
jgi:hypothetical protein